MEVRAKVLTLWLSGAERALVFSTKFTRGNHKCSCSHSFFCNQDRRDGLHAAPWNLVPASALGGLRQISVLGLCPLVRKLSPGKLTNFGHLLRCDKFPLRSYGVAFGRKSSRILAIAHKCALDISVFRGMFGRCAMRHMRDEL